MSDTSSEYGEAAYKIIGEEAYTLDNIIIKNVYMDLPKIATEKNTLKYFSEFGKISSYQWVDEDKLKRCYINFCDAKVAAIVLGIYVCQNNDVEVLACESWQQPDGERRIIEILTEHVGTDYRPSNAKPDPESLILTLNDDCLECICKKLPAGDQINFALTCQRFSGILRLLACVEYRHLNIDILSLKKLTLFQIKIFLLIVGPQVKVLMGSLNFDDVFEPAATSRTLRLYEMLGIYCTNVENLQIETFDMEAKTFMLLTEKLQFLNELWLNDYLLTDVTIKCVESLTNVKNLFIMDNKKLTGKHIYNFCGVERLSLKNCRNIEPYHFKQICKNLTNLRYLDITGCILLKTDDFEHILKHLLQLEIVKLSTTHENYNSIAQLPKLKQLSITEYIFATISVDFLQNLAKHQAHQLQELILHGTSVVNVVMASFVSELKNLKVFVCCSSDTLNDECLAKLAKLTALEDVHIDGNEYINNTGCLQLIKGCFKLKNLTLRNCDLLKPDLIPKALKILQEQRLSGQRTDCVHIILTAKRTFQSMIDEYLTEDSLDVLRVTMKKVTTGIFNIGGKIYIRENYQDDNVSFEIVELSDNSSEEDRSMTESYQDDNISIEIDSDEDDEDDDLSEEHFYDDVDEEDCDNNFEEDCNDAVDEEDCDNKMSFLADFNDAVDEEVCEDMSFLKDFNEVVEEDCDDMSFLEEHDL
ncbi:uncharacterized protein LOC135961121 [Calliphora vicina]|uniref:uncharacterized protein LOC135961121 n=1 Tax=Calliphora vicina TaxID=7373 RepID=UPI00325C2D14